MDTMQSIVKYEYVTIQLYFISVIILSNIKTYLITQTSRKVEDNNER